MAQKDVEAFKKRYLVLVLSSALIVSIIPLFSESYVNVGAWCWIDFSALGQVLSCFVFTMFRLCIFFSCFFCLWLP